MTSRPGEPERQPLLLAVDAPSLLHRSHHARSSSDLRDRGGRPAWALHGMLRQVLEVVDTLAPDALVLGLDDRTSSVRAQDYPAYKAGRAEKDAALVEQLDRAGALLDALGLLAVTPPGLEADDVGASAAALAGAHGWRCTLVTSDRDAFAHISEHTSVLRLIPGGIGASPTLTPPRLHQMYGVPAGRYLEYAALRGDASDNLPGVAGIGEKSAALLLEVAGSMAAVWADLEHCAGATVAAALDSWCLEEGRPRVGRRVLAALRAEGARERWEFNVRMMSGRTDVDLGLDLAGGSPAGRLPVEVGRVRRVVDHLGDPALTEEAVRVLSPPG